MDMPTQNKTIYTYDANAAADPNSGVFGLPYSYEDSQLVFLPVPWEATTSYGGGTAHGPEAILNASSQIDLFDLDVLNPDRAGLHCLDIDPAIVKLNDRAKKTAQTIKDAYGVIDGHSELIANLKLVNELSGELNAWVKGKISSILKDGKIAALIGGDHSTPFGAFEAVAEHFGEFGILHIDAHSDTRKAYMGFEHSHASIMYNAATKIPKIKTITQVGIRDFCDEEFSFTQSRKHQFNVFFDQMISAHRLNGKPFNELLTRIVDTLPQQVWVSFDIDGLDPRYCPHTGTPVPGGIDYSEAVMLLRMVAKSGRKILGFDLNEVAPILDEQGLPAEINQAADEWDANVGMRLLYKLSALTLASQKKSAWRET